jgi:8-hydroxy-5-deazaflavin:NADPH oxidoreductase
MSKRIGIIGSGMVGIALANGLQRHGYQIMIGTNDVSKHASIREKINGEVTIGDFQQTAQYADLLILAVKGLNAEEAVRKAGIKNLIGKTVLDATNPIADAPPTNGVIPFFTTMHESLMERLQALAPETLFVKCFSCVGNALMVDPDFKGEKPTMFICGNSDDAKKTTIDLLAEIGWDAEDMGKVEAARAIEPLCILWCLPGINRGQWSHAFKLLK